MAEQIQVQEKPQTQNNEQRSDVSDFLRKSMWGDAPTSDTVATVEDKPTPQQQVAEPQPEAQVQNDKPKDDDEEVLDINDWLKREFEVEDVDKFKQTYNELKKLKDTPKEPEIKFNDDTSRLIYENLQGKKYKEVRQFLETQERLDAVLNNEVSKKNADDIIKLSMQLKYKDLTPAEIDYKFNKQYAIPKEPKQTDIETDEEFALRKAEWQEQVNDIEMTKLIDAKLAKPELEKSKSELILPEIAPKGNEQLQPQISQEDLANLDKLKNSFLESSENLLKDFNGFKVNVKNKDVDYNIDYAISKEDKETISGLVKQFAENNFDVNSMFAQRWVNDDNTINTAQMIKDLSNMLLSEKAQQKIANEAANQRLELYLKQKKNIQLDTSSPANVPNLDKKNISEILQEKFWG